MVGSGIMKVIIFLLILSSNLVQAAGLADSLESIRKSHSLPSLAAAILIDGKIEDIAAVGLRKIGTNFNITTEDKFHIGSCTKSMTAMLISMFVEENKLSWNSTLPEMFPELTIHPSYHNVTLEMLITHRSGMPNGIPAYENIAEEFKKTKTAVEDRALTTKYVLGLEPKYTPNTIDSYNNTAYVIAAHAIERISGKSWEDLTIEKIFRPLKMESCGYGSLSDPQESSPLQPWGHYLDTSRNEIIPYHKDNPEMWGPAGRVHCSLRDWAKYIQIHIDGFHGKDSLVKSSTFTKLQSKSELSQMDYTAGGWFRLERTWAHGPALTHNGTNLVNYARVWVAPVRKAAMLVVTNMGGDQEFTGNDETISKTALATNEAVSLLIKEHLK